MREADIALLSEAVRGAGEVALRFWRGENRVWDKGNDDPVSEADLAVEAFLRDRLHVAAPDTGWLSEETPDDLSRIDATRVFIVDPIDGTRAFVAGQETWAHSVALAENGRIVAGAVFLPARDELFLATFGGGATLNGATVRASGRGGVTGASILAPRPSLDPGLWPGGVPALKREFRPSLAYRLCLVASGQFDGMLTLRDCWEWDIAAGSLIAAEAGATVTDREGLPLGFNSLARKTAGAIAASPAVHDGLMRGLGVAA